MPNLRQKRQLDSLVGIPLCTVLGVLTRVVGYIARSDDSLVRTPRRLLVIKLVGQGSIVNATHLLRAAKERWPQVELHFVGLREIRPLLERIPDVDHLHIIDDRSYLRLVLSTLGFLITARRLRFDLVVDLEMHSKCSTALSVLTGANHRAGCFLDTAPLRRALHTHTVTCNPLHHLQVTYRRVGRALGLQPRVGRALPPRVDEDDRAALAAKLAQWRLGERKLLLVNVNAGELCLERRWPTDRFASIIGEFSARGDTRVVLIGAPSEIAYVESVLVQVDDDVRGEVVNAAGRLAYGEFLALLEAADALLTGDTGPMHLAAALGTTTVSLWGPTLPRVYRPPGPTHQTIYHAARCSPCIGSLPGPPCGGQNVCMEMISVDEVSRALAAALDVAPHATPGTETVTGSDAGRDRAQDNGDPRVSADAADVGRALR